MQRILLQHILWIVLQLFFLSACNAQTPEIVNTVESANVPLSSATASLVPTDTQELTLTSTPEASAAIEIPSATPAVSEMNELITPTLEASITGSPRISEIDQMEQIYIPAGEFIMGSTDREAKQTEDGGRAYPEIPQHTVYLDEYWIDKYEVTTRQYALCVDIGACEPPYLYESETRDHYYDNPKYDNYPVIWVNWYMSYTYCEWAGRRLPTEAEWEKAARGTDGRKYPWGNDPVDGERANFCDENCPRDIANDKYADGFADTAPVGSYPAGASPYGVMDMSGNVWEWTHSIIQPYPYDPESGREASQEVYAERVWRGGTWSNGYWWLRSSVRYRSIPTYWYVNLGFRCAASE
jgi:serine/threonine-protein kinase